jgi:hypothetical protein
MRAERVFAYQRAVGCDAVSKIVVFSRVYAVNTVTEKSDRGTIGIERPAVRGSIDALGEAADDGIAALREITLELNRIARAALSRVAAADYSDGRQM